ncbi:Calcium-binding EF-hand family protein [Theobroma cacao]|uniref:Calcineurin B-like protein n=1 Tax=Theobroma cacao TaxID=3641 RepID=A0A061DTL4_THECC|nr:Calcium-binding EF-hand family protein [Theobroma cacao]
MGSSCSKDSGAVNDPTPENFDNLASETPRRTATCIIHKQPRLKPRTQCSVSGYLPPKVLLSPVTYLQMFDVFDDNRNGQVDFGEFVCSLGIFHPKTPQETKTGYAFKLYDLRHTSCIEHEETFTEADAKGDGWIDEEEWKGYVTKSPLLLKNMTCPYLISDVYSPPRVIAQAFPSFVLNGEAEHSKQHT